MTLFLSLAAVLILRGPLGKAIADAISRGRSEPGRSLEAGRVVQLEAEMDGLRQRLTELEERQDFSERLLAQQRDRSALGPGA